MEPPLEVPVFLDGWQIECCQPPPSQGDQVTWPLMWVDDPTGPGGLRIDWRSEPLGSGAGNEPGDLLLRHGPLAAYWRGPAALSARGRLLAGVHGGVPELVPALRATVVSVDVVEQAYRLSGPRSYVPIAGDFRLRPVARSPEWFNSDPPVEDRLPDPMREDSGVLVRLSVDSG